MAKANPIDASPLREIKVRWGTEGQFFSSHASDISVNGAFINTPEPLPQGTTIGLRLETGGRELSTQAVVRRVIPGEGMGVEFQSMAPEDRARLEVMVRQAEEEIVVEAPQPSESPTPDPNLQRSRIRTTPERRARVRYKFAATAEITEDGAKKSVSGQLSDIGNSGCYVRLSTPLAPGASGEIRIAHSGQSFRTRATVRSAHPGKGMSLSFNDIAPDDQRVLDDWLSTSMERAWLSTNRRRSQRVMVSIPVQVEAKDSNGVELHEDTRTISVSANGALLALEMELIKGQTVTLRDPISQNALECSVAYLGSSQQGRREVGVSFLKPNNSPWKITFPPTDWSMQDPYAKGS